MILDKINEKIELKRSQKKANPININILKKCLSDVNINNKNNKNNNFVSTNDLSIINSLRKKENSFYLNNLQRQSSQISSLYPISLVKNKALSTKNIFRKKLNEKLFSQKTADKMWKKFYLRNREGAYDLENNYNLFDRTIKHHDKIVKKILFDYNDIRNYEKEALNNSISHYKQNLEILENQNKVKEHRVLRDSKKFEILKNFNNRKILFSPNIKKLSESPASLFSSPKYKSPLRESPSVKKDKYKEKYQEVLLSKKYYNYYIYKKYKENSKKFCHQVRNLEQECDLYEPIDEEASKMNLKRNNFYNLANLERIIKLECLKDERFSNEDYEFNISFLKKCSKDYRFCSDKEISGYYPAFIKKNHFLLETIKKYGSLKGKYFGIPV